MEIYTDNFNPEQLILSYTIPIAGLNTTTYQVSFAGLDSYMHSNLRKCAVYNVAIGSCLVLMILSWVMIRNKKNVVFIINQSILVIMAIRSSLYLSYQLGPLSSLTFGFTNFLNSDLKKSYNVVMACDICQIILVALIEISMTYQIHIIFKSPEVRKIGYVLSLLVMLLGMGTLSLYIYSVTLSAKSFYKLFITGNATISEGDWIKNTPFILFSISINIMSFLLVVKLFFAIRTRRYLGLKQFDSFHILLIMASQTMLIPSILVITNYFLSSQSDNLLSSCSFLLVVLSLPLTSMWAAAANNYSKPTSIPSNIFEYNDPPQSANSSVSEVSYTFFPSKLSTVSTINSNIEKKTIRFENQEFTKNIPSSANTYVSHDTLVHQTYDNSDIVSNFSRVDSFDRAIQSMGPNTYESITSNNLKY